ncbi:MAG: hypothetical protein LBJ00_02095 [Planctomycetaceae bacterium]|nr:hypothetical protein [Planctomycetaceae bacterium]
MSATKSEVTLKVQVANKYFSKFALSFDEKFIDLIVEPQADGLFAPFLWAESKKDVAEITSMFAQLLLTIKPIYDKGKKNLPKYIGVFDKNKIAFVEFYHILPIFLLNDFNWNEKPSNVSEKTENTVAKFLYPKNKSQDNSIVIYEFYFGKDENGLKEFIKNNFTFSGDTVRDYMIDRRDLLIPQKIREQKGAYFTPKIWVEKSQEYLEKSFGENWQDEYYVWDCCCGTGNLLAGLTNPDNVWASTIDQPDVDIIHNSIEQGLNLLKPHVFRFDFLNDDFDNLPVKLKEIINDPEKRKKLIVYINPPYAEATNAKTVTRTGQNKTGVTTNYQINNDLKPLIGKATNELSALFFGRIYRDIVGCQLAVFSKLAFVCNLNYIKFRRFFEAKFNGGFVVPANTFDNVNGQFPIGFTIWDTSVKTVITQITLDVMGNDTKNKNARKTDTKRFFATKGDSINTWIKEYNMRKNETIGFMGTPAPDFQHHNCPYITEEKGTRHFNYYPFHIGNIIEGSIYFSVRQVFEHTWLNDRDQFLYPNNGYKRNKFFQNNCLMFTLFHQQNRIQSKNRVNHWIPFSRKDVKSKNSFASTFMYDFLQTRGKFGKEANNVFIAGKALWSYYHETIKSDDNADVNASLYDIREYFKGRTNGRLNTKSTDQKFNELDQALKDSLKNLGEMIKPKVYEYGFLLE